MGRKFDFDDLDTDFDFDMPRRSSNSGRQNSRGPVRSNPGQSKNRRRKKRRRRNPLIKLIPAFVAIVLIFIVVIISIKTGLFESFSYNSDTADISTYFGNVSDGYAVVVADDGSLTDENLKVVNDEIYMPLSEIKDRYVDRFYYDVNDNELKYTTDSDVIYSVIGSSSFCKGGVESAVPYQISFLEGEDLYVALDYVKQFYNIEIQLFGGDAEPYRVTLKDEWNSNDYVMVDKEHALRTGADKKSEILRDLDKGCKLRVVTREDGSSDGGSEWTFVETEDLICGFVENRYISDVYSEPDTPVTDVLEENFSSLTKDSKVVLMWHNIAGIAGNEGIGNILDSTSGITVIAPTWFSISDNDGTVSSFATNDYVSVVHDRGMEVWGVVDNFNTAGVSSFEVLSHSSIRAHVIEQLINYATQYQLDGINVDFETLSEDCGEHFIQFIRELSIECRKQNLILSVDNYVPKVYNDFYNRREQGIFADYVVIMGYDEHFSGSKEAGSVASLGYVTEGIDETLKDVPSNKVINALPLYTRIWEETPKSAEVIAAEEPGSEFIPYDLSVFLTLACDDAVNYVKDKGAQLTWDDDCAQYYATWSLGGKTYETWLEEEESLKAKLEVMKNKNLGGVAAWQLSFAPKYLWDLLKSYQ